MTDTIHPTPLDAEEASQLREDLYNATIIERIDTHGDLARFRIRPDRPIPPFEPGQYVALGLGNWEVRLQGTQAEAVPDKKLRKLSRRAYSISCPLIDSRGNLVTVDSLDFLEFYITLVRQADSPDKKPPILTPRLFNRSAGDRIEVQKKITGNYTLEQYGPNDTILMLGTGTGEAPHNAMTAKLLRENHRGRVVNVSCVRRRDDLGYLAEHQALMNLFSNYRYLSFTTRDPINLDPSHPDYVGKQYLQDVYCSGQLAELAEDDLSPSNTHVFLCGNPAMIGYVPPGSDPPETPGMLPILRDAGFTDESGASGPGTIRFEKYW